MIFARAVANTLPFVLFQVLVTNFSNKSDHQPKTMVLVPGAEVQRLRPPHSGKFGRMPAQGEANAEYIGSENKDSQTRNHEGVTKIDEERLDQDGAKK